MLAVHPGGVFHVVQAPSPRVWIELLNSVLQLHGAEGRDVLHRNSCFVAEERCVPEHVGQSALKLVSLLWRQGKATSRVPCGEKRADFPSLFLQAGDRKSDSVAIVAQGRRHLGGKCLELLECFHSLGLAAGAAVGSQPITRSGRVTPAPAALESSASRFSKQKRDHDS